jgi:hypothetical protein
MLKKRNSLMYFRVRTRKFITTLEKERKTGKYG